MKASLDGVTVTPRALTRVEQAELIGVLRTLRADIAHLELFAEAPAWDAQEVRALTKTALNLARLAAKSTLTSSDLHALRTAAADLAGWRERKSGAGPVRSHSRP